MTAAAPRVQRTALAVAPAAGVAGNVRRRTAAARSRAAALLWVAAACLPAAATPAATGADPAGASVMAQVLERLRREIAAEPASNPTPIDTVLARHADRTGTSFDVESAGGDDGAPAPAPPRPAGVSDGEWRALQRYWAEPARAQDDPPESNSREHTLIDLDEDGQRDLVTDTYVGGTGLFTEIAVYRRDPARGFSATDAEAAADAELPGVFSINGRGGDQALYWLRIDGRSYAAYRDGDYFQDTVTLSRPLSALAAERAWPHALQVRYRHRHALADAPQDGSQDEPQAQATARLLAQDPALRQALQRQLQALEFDAQGRQRRPDPAARCPAPATADDPEERERWPWRDAGHYTFDYVADLRIRTPRGCYGASIVAFRSSYTTSYDTCCVLWGYDGPGQQAFDLPLQSRRERASVAIVATPPAGQ